MVHHTSADDMPRTNGHLTSLNTNTDNPKDSSSNNNNNNNMSHLDAAATGAGGKLWIFGYGSLVWNPGFQYTNFMVGHVKGFKRRFWQGNTVHRGSPDKPGRVVTVVQDEQSETWGLAFQVTNSSSALDYLDNRESHLGGYRTSMTTFHPKDSTTGEPFQVLMYVGGHVNTKDDTDDGADGVGVGDMYLGPAPLEDVADQVVSARGSCGHNVEYVLRLAHFMRAFAPHVRDDHLFKLEHLVLGRLKDDQCDLSALMPPPTVPTHPRQPNNLAGCRVNTQNTHVSVSQSAPKKKHGCLNM